MGTLQPILKDLLSQDMSTMKQVFGANLTVLEQVLKKDVNAQILWATSITDAANKHKLINPWREMFMALGATLPCQERQIRAAQWYYNQAEFLFNEYQLFSERGYALMFDIAVQNGSINKTVKERILTGFQGIPKSYDIYQKEIEKMRIIAQKRAEVCGQWKNDVLSRKMCIATGKGYVHGLNIDLASYQIKLNKVQTMDMKV
jgi:hypothetical protein